MWDDFQLLFGGEGGVFGKGDGALDAELVSSVNVVNGLAMRDDFRSLFGGEGGASWEGEWGSLILSLMDFFMATRKEEHMPRLVPLIDFIGLK
jgi:hypothetical protein